MMTGIQTNQTLKAIAVSMALFVAPLLFLSSNQAAASNESEKPNATLRFSLSDNKHGFPSDEAKENFDCTDKIYAVTELQGFDKGKYTVEFRWLDPEGGTRERTQYDFFVRDQPTTKLWAWLVLHRAKGASMVQWINPAAGLEEFIGQWRLELLINGKELKQGEFEVSC